MQHVSHLVSVLYFQKEIHRIGNVTKNCSRVRVKLGANNTYSSKVELPEKNTEVMQRSIFTLLLTTPESNHNYFFSVENCSGWTKMYKVL